MSEMGVIIWENALYLAKKLHGWDKNDIAKHSHTAITTLNSIENGTRGMGDVVLKRIADALGVSVRTVICGGFQRPNYREKGLKSDTPEPEECTVRKQKAG